MRPFRLRATDSDLAELRRLTTMRHPLEGAAFALAGISRHARGTDLLVRRPIDLPDTAYDIQEELRLKISSSAINGLAALCEANRLGAVLCHSHPGDVGYSSADDHGEARLYHALSAILPEGAPIGSLLFTPNTVQGRVWTASGPVDIQTITSIGRTVHHRRSPEMDGGRDRDDAQLFDRQVRAFGQEGQRCISAAKVAVIGVGGTGSATAEQLVRLGVSDLLLIDHDHFDSSNLSRMYGTFSDTAVGQPKVELVAEHLRRISPPIAIECVCDSVVLDSTASMLRDRDVLLLCTDDHWGRAVVNQVSHQYLIPAINVGMRFAPLGEEAVGHGALDVIRPGNACLWCKQAINAGRIAAESMSLEERTRRHQDGYVDDIDTPAPSVVSITTTLAGMAVTQFLQLVTDFMGEGGDVCRLNSFLLEGQVRRGRTKPKSPCVCSQVKARGDLAPLDTLKSLRPEGSPQ